MENVCVLMENGMSTLGSQVLSAYFALCGLQDTACYKLIQTYNIFHRDQSWRSGTRCDCKTDWLWVRSPLEEMKYLLKFIFPFLRSGVEVKRGVEFCHSTRNTSRIRQKVGNGSVLTLGSLCLPCCVRDIA